MLIVDAQVHTWAASTPERPWSGGGEPQRTVPFTNEDLLKEMDVAGVHRAVLVPPGWEGSRNDLALAAARAHPDRFAVMGRIAPQVFVAAKASALPCYTNDAYPFRLLHPYIRQAYDAFGPQRVFWGTDLSRSPISYRQQVTMFTEEIPWLSVDDKEWIMGRGICEWLGWAYP
jgi:predicted TIM-barrel fold metal-dependent hydrolase